MNVFISGGCGFLGSNIASSYLKEGAHVVVVDALFRQGSIANLEWLRSLDTLGRLEYSNADLANADAIDAIFREKGPFDYICHLGGQVAMTTSLENPRRDFLTNAMGTFNLLEAARQYSPDCLFAYSSTNKVYGDLLDLNYVEGQKRYSVREYPEGFNETLRLDFASPYGCSKGAADQYVRDWYRNFGIKTVVFRHSSIYGGRQFSTFDQGWIGWFVSQTLRQSMAAQLGEASEPFTIAGNGKQVRDVLHAEDLVSLYRSAYYARATIGGEVFNIGGGMRNSLSLLELFELMAELLDTESEFDIQKMPRRQSDQNVFVADISKAKRLLGWEPKISSREGILKMLEWVRTSASK